MAAHLADLKQEWHRFRHDKPGERFRNHNERAQKKSKKHAAVTITLGVLLIAAHSKKMSGALDRAEPRVRERGHRIERRWKALPRLQQAAVIAGGILLVTAGMLAMWRWVVAGYLL